MIRYHVAIPGVDASQVGANAVRIGTGIAGVHLGIFMVPDPDGRWCKADAAEDELTEAVAAAEDKARGWICRAGRAEVDRDAARADLLALARLVVVATKHGPRGRGGSGPCSEGCAKCAAETILDRERATDLAVPK